MSEELDRLYLRSKLKASEEKAVKDLEGKLDKLLAKLEDRDLIGELMADWNDFKENLEKAGEENGKGKQTSVKELEEKLDKLLAKLEDRDLSEELKADWKNDFKQEEEGMRN